MLNIVVLPVNKNPILRTYHYLAFPISIITAYNEEQKFPLILNRYINCSYILEKDDLNIDDNDWMLLGSGIFDGQYFMIDPKVVSDKALDIISLFKCMIDNGYYVLGHFDEYYISCKEVYKKHHFDHDYLLYGYDEAKSEFLSIGYTGTMTKYSEFRIGYEELFEASKNIPGEKLNINLVKLNTDFKYNIDIISIKNQLKDYLNSESQFFRNSVERLYGYNAVKKLINRINNELKINSDIDLRGIRALYELKNLMFVRLDYLKREGYIKIDDNKLNEYYKFVLFLKSFFKMCIEYNTERKNVFLNNNINKLKSIIDEEYDYLNSIYNLLS